MRILVLVLAATGCATVSPSARIASEPSDDRESTGAVAPTESAQPRASLPTPVDALWSDVSDAFWGYNLFYYAGAFAATGVMSQSGADHELRVQAQRHFDSGTWNEAANIGGYVVPLVTAPTIWVVGLVAKDRTIAGAGSAALLALGVAATTTGVLKVVAGRADPGAELDDSDIAREFRPFQNDIGAWPSGHTTSTISIAAALTAYAPEHVWIPLLGYPLGLALGIGMVERDSHWASDVVAGALIGHGIGYSIGRNFRKRVRGEPVEAEAWQLAPMSGAKGLALGRRW